MEITVALAIICAVIAGLLAKRKNRNPWVWGFVGALSLLGALLVLAFMPYKCPKCDQSLTNDQGKKNICPNCRSLPTHRDDAEKYTIKHPKPTSENPIAFVTEQLWAAALTEFEGASRRQGLWARLFAESGGNEAFAKAEYLKTRATELANDHAKTTTPINSSSSSQTKLAADLEPLAFQIWFADSSPDALFNFLKSRGLEDEYSRELIKKIVNWT